MESVTKEFEIEIGPIVYTFSIEFNYYEGKWALDPTESEDAELDSWDFDGPINAWDNRTDIGYEVTNANEIEVIKEEIDIYSLFEDAIS